MKLKYAAHTYCAVVYWESPQNHIHKFNGAVIISVLQYSTFCVSRITINKLFDTILYHDTIMKWSRVVMSGMAY